MSKNIKDQQIRVEGGVGSVINPADAYREYMTSVAYVEHNRNFASYTFATNAKDGTWPGREFGEEQDWLIRKDKGGYKEAIYRHHTPAADTITPDLLETMCVDSKDVEAMEKSGEVEKLALELYPVAMHSPSPHPSNWEMNEQHRKQWIMGYNHRQPELDRLTAENKALREALSEISELPDGYGIYCKKIATNALKTK